MVTFFCKTWTFRSLLSELC